MANSVDPDEMPHIAASHLGQHCLLMPVCPNTYGEYVTLNGCYNNLHFIAILSLTLKAQVKTGADDIFSEHKNTCIECRLIQILLGSFRTDTYIATVHAKIALPTFEAMIKLPGIHVRAVKRYAMSSALNR